MILNIIIFLLSFQIISYGAPLKRVDKRVYVKEFSLQGADSLNNRELQKILTPYRKRMFSISEINLLTSMIKNKYLQYGFNKVSVYISKQKIQNGILKIIINKNPDKEENQNIREMKTVKLIFIKNKEITINTVINNETIDSKNWGISSHIGSYLKHIKPAKKDIHTEGFANNYFDIGYSISEETKILVGTLKNSRGNRCLLLGVEHTWFNYSDRISLEGAYSYVGEFFFEEFKHCGDSGIYKKIKELTKIGFTPYISHNLEFDITNNISLDVGFIAPFMPFATIQLKF